MPNVLNKSFFGILLLLAVQSSFSQNKQPTKQFGLFDSLVNFLRDHSYPRDTFKLPLISKERGFSVTISANPVSLDLVDTVIKNPYGNKYPISYSVIFQNNLVALFEPGNLVCYQLPSLKRNLELERKLNTIELEYFWLVDGKLVGRTNGEFNYLTADYTWETYSERLPIKNRSKLFEDDRYFIFSDCDGEFGGTIYFYNKLDLTLHFTEATCANTVSKKNGKYLVLSHLGHMQGSSHLKIIEDPEKLPTFRPSKTQKPSIRRALGYSDTTKHAKKVFDFYGIQTFSCFSTENRTLFLTNWRDRTFLSEITDSTFSIVNPLYNSSLYTHRPVTTAYEKTSLVNLDNSDVGPGTEATVLIINGNKLTRVDWNEKHNL